jgi:hypothetical protein
MRSESCTSTGNCTVELILAVGVELAHARCIAPNFSSDVFDRAKQLKTSL